MFKIFHRGHKVQFNEDDLKKQESKRNSYFYTGPDEDSSEQSSSAASKVHVAGNSEEQQRVKANNLSVSNSNTKALNGHHLESSKRYSSIQHLPKPSANGGGGGGYEEESDHGDGLKEKLMNRYTNVTTLLMRSFRKAKIKKKKENEEKRKSSHDAVEESAAIYRPINRDEIFNRNSPKILKQSDNSKTNHLTIPAGEDDDDDDDDDDDNGEDDGNQDDVDEEEDDSAVPVCIGVKVISDDFVNYPIKIGDKLQAGKNEAQIKSSNVETKTQSLSRSSPPAKLVTQVKPAQAATKTDAPAMRSQTPVRTIYSHTKPQAPVRPPDIKSSEVKSHGAKLGCETLPRNTMTGAMQASTPAKLPASTSKCTPLIGERKKIFEANGGNNTISSGISLNKIGYFNSLSKKTAADLANEQKNAPKVAVSSIRGTKTFEKFTNGSTTSMVMAQNNAKRDKELSYQSTASIAGASASNNLSKADKLTITSLHNANGEKKQVTVKRTKTFTQQLNEMLEQYKKMGSSTSITSIEKTEAAQKMQQTHKPAQKESIGKLVDSPVKPATPGTPSSSKYGFMLSTNSKSEKPRDRQHVSSVSSASNYRPRADSVSDSSASSTTMKVNNDKSTSSHHVVASKIPLSTSRINGTVSGAKSQNESAKAAESSNSSKYGIVKGSKDAKEIYLRSISKNSAMSLNDKINKTRSQFKSPDGFFTRSANTDTEVDRRRYEAVESNNDIYSSLKFPEPAENANKMFSPKFYGHMKDKMKNESYIKAASDFDDNRFINGKKNYEVSDDDGIQETRRKIEKLIKHQHLDAEKESRTGSSSTGSSTKTSNDFKALVNVLEKQDNDFKYKFFNCLMPKLWDAALPYDEYLQLNKLMTALFGERYHELDQSTRNLAEELRRKSSFSKYELKEQYEKTQAYEANIKRLIKDYLKSPSKQTLEDFDLESMSVYNDIFDDDDSSSYKSVNHLINTLRRRQVNEHPMKSAVKLARTDSSASRKLTTESSRSDYESYSDNAYSRPYKVSSQHKSLFANKHQRRKSTNEDLKSSLFLQLKEQEDVSEDTDYVSKQSDIWTQSFESSERVGDGDHIYGTVVNYRNKPQIYHRSDRSDRSEELRDKLRNSLQNFNQDELPKESLKNKIQAFNRLSLSAADKPANAKVGFSPQTPRKQNTSKRPSYPDIVIESTLEDKNEAAVITSFQPASILSSSRTSITDSKTSLLRAKSPSLLSNGGQRLQAYRPKLLTNQLVDPSSSSITQDSTLISNSKNDFGGNDSLLDMSFSKANDLLTRSITRISPRQQQHSIKEGQYRQHKYSQPDVVSNYDTHSKQQQQQQAKSSTYAKSPVIERSSMNSLKKALMKDNNNNSDYEAFINRKKSELMEKELMNSFNEFYMNREFSYNKSLPKSSKAASNELNSFNKTNVYDRIEIYDALY